MVIFGRLDVELNLIDFSPNFDEPTPLYDESLSIGISIHKAYSRAQAYDLSFVFYWILKEEKKVKRNIQNFQGAKSCCAQPSKKNYCVMPMLI